MSNAKATPIQKVAEKHVNRLVMM